MNPIVLQVALIFLPGLVWATIDARYGRGARPAEFQLILRAFLFGLVAHGVTFLIYAAAGLTYDVPKFGGEKDPILEARLADEVVVALGVALVLAVLWLYFSNYKLIVRFLQAIKATSRYGDEDVWDYTFNSKDASVEYVHVRDFANELTYAGWVDVYSDSGALRELTLRDVRVHGFDGELKYEMPRMYLARKSDDIHIEFPSKGT